MFFLVLSLLAGDKAILLQGTSGSRSAVLEVHAGGVVVRTGEAAVAFGTVRVGTGKRQLSYFVVIRHRLVESARAESSEQVTLEDLGAKAKHTVTLDGKEVVIGHTLELSPATKKLVREALVVNGKVTVPAEGRVFVVDLTATPPTVEHKKLKLPEDVGDVTTEKGAADLAAKVLTSLAKQDRKLKALLSPKESP